MLMYRGLPQARAFTAKAACCSACFLLTFLPAIASAGSYGGGTGEPNNPYRIVTAEDLNDIGSYEEDWDKYFILVNDVNLAGYTGTQFKIIGRWIYYDDPRNKPFVGIFDGNNHKVWNFTWTSDAIDGIGLFGYVGDAGQIKNLGLENIDVNATNGECVGGLVGQNYWNGALTNCYLTGNVSGKYNVGGLVGQTYGGAITKCYSTCLVSGSLYVGGLVGTNDSLITDCYSTGSVAGGRAVGGLVGLNRSEMKGNSHSTGCVSGTSYVGGLAGLNDRTITNCYSTANVSGTGRYVGGLIGSNDYPGAIIECYSIGTVNGNDYVGGLVGINGYSSGATITNCYSTASVSGSRWTGGVAGYNYRGEITTCYSTGSVSGTGMDAGGLVGHNGDTISECYSTGNVSGDPNVGGLVGHNLTIIKKCYSTGSVSGTQYAGGSVGRNDGTVSDSFWDTETSGRSESAAGIGKTTVEMKMMRTFASAGWDFIEVWDIGENQTYPFLRTYLAGDINHDGVVDFRDITHFAADWLSGME